MVLVLIDKKDILTGSPHHKKVVFSGALHKINNKYDTNDLKVKVKNMNIRNFKKFLIFIFLIK